MKTSSWFSSIVIILLSQGIYQVYGQWGANGNHIYNTNSGYVGIGTNSPATLLHVARNMTEPNIVVQNLGGNGGATFTMIDNASSANWKFKATLSGGFKIRDHANGLDVIVLEPNAMANAFYLKNSGSIGIGTSSPDASSLMELSSGTKGFLLPRMTSENRSAIASPAKGLIVYQTDSPAGIFYNEGTPGSPDWRRLWLADSSGWQLNYATNSIFLKSQMTKVGIGTSSPSANFHLVGSYIHLDSGPDDSWGRESVVTQNGVLDANGDFYVLVPPSCYWAWSNDNYMFKVEVFVSLDYNSDYPHFERGSGYSRAIVAKERGNNLTYFYKEIELSKDATITFSYSNSAPQDLRIDVNTDRLSGIVYKVVVKISS